MLTKPPKLWCRYEFIVHNHQWNSEIVPQWIQQKISKKVTETDSQKLEFDNCKQQLFALTMCLPACLWDHVARSPGLISRSQLGRFLQNVMTINFRYWFSSIRNIYRVASMFIITQALGTPRDVERRESGSMFCETNHFLKFERIE